MFDGSVLMLYRFILDFELQKFRAEKFQTTITFVRELRLRRSKNESCSKSHNEARGHPERDFNSNFFSKFHCLRCTMSKTFYSSSI